MKQQERISVSADVNVGELVVAEIVLRLRMPVWDCLDHVNCCGEIYLIRGQYHLPVGILQCVKWRK